MSNGLSFTRPRHVNLFAGVDFTCALLGSLGFSTRLIMEHTDLTPSQVGYRLRLGGVRRSDYRNGASAVASAMLQKARGIARPVVREQLQAALAQRKEPEG
jgi:hypothetical protein